MGAITVRNLPESVHDELRLMAAANNLSVEALVRNLLGEAARDGGANAGKADGLSDASAPRRGAAVPARLRLGALGGAARVYPGAP